VAIFANGPATQTTTVGTASGTVAIFNTAASGVTGTLPSILVINTGTITAYIGGATAVTVAGLPLPSGYSLLLKGPAVNLYAITSSGTTTLVAGLGTQTVAD
jgi:hypothetical protein